MPDQTNDTDIIANIFYTVNDIMKISKNLAYDLVQQAYENKSPFPVIKVGTSYRISKRKFDLYSEGITENLRT